MKGRASARSSTRSPRNAWRFRWRTAPSRSMSPSRQGSSCTRCCVAADPILLFGAGLLGLCLGSFLNVCIVRLPNDQSLLSPSSACPHCKHPIAWRDNIPVASWLLLKGRCRHCGVPISRQYPVVEAAVGPIWIAGVLAYGVSVQALTAGLFGTLLLGIAVTDARHYLIPDEYTWGGLVIGLALSLSTGVPGLLQARSEEHTSELQSQSNLVCRLLLENNKRSFLCTA